MKRNGYYQSKSYKHKNIKTIFKQKHHSSSEKNKQILNDEKNANKVLKKRSLAAAGSLDLNLVNLTLPKPTFEANFDTRSDWRGPIGNNTIKPLKSQPGLINASTTHKDTLLNDNNQSLEYSFKPLHPLITTADSLADSTVQETHPAAKLSVICIALMPIGGISALFIIPFALIALNDIAKEPELYKGKSMAIVGLVFGFLLLIALALILVYVTDTVWFCILIVILAIWLLIYGLTR
ncbi:DUF4190 domain-containing protein [bacterium]|nr:DUF4190 domain-containing protein [bacterium]